MAQALKPQVYFWTGEPAVGSGTPPWVHNPLYQGLFFMGDNNNWPGTTPQHAVDAIRIDLLDRIAHGRFTDQGDGALMGVVIYGFATENPYQLSPGTEFSSLYHPDDALSGGSWELRKYQPWTTNAIGRAHAWMEDFIAIWTQDSELGAHSPPRIPAVIAFDCENVLSAGVDNLWKVAHDARWETQPVPGFGTAKMKDLYDVVRVQYGWPQYIYDGINTGENWDSPTNRPYMLWYTNICAQARNGFLYEAAYSAIHDSWTNVIVSNYGDGAVDNDQNWVTSWYVDNQQRSGPALPTACGLSTDDQYGAPSRSFPRAIINGFPSGALMLPETANDNPIGRWMSNWLDISADPLAAQQFAAPVCYVVSRSNCQRQLYRPPASPWTSKPNEKCWDASMRVGRHNVEAMIDTLQMEAGDIRLSPWVPFFTHFVEGEEGMQDDTYVGPGELTRLLSMLRAKNVPQLIAFAGTNEADGWANFDRIYRNVHAPQLTAYVVTHGTEPVGQDHKEDRLRYTLRKSGSPYTVQIDATTNNTLLYSTELTVTFDNVTDSPASTDYGLRFNVECSVDKDNVTGVLYVKNNAANGWDPIAPDEPANPNDVVYSFYTPDHSARPTFHIGCPDAQLKYVDNTGRVVIRLFQMRFDGDQTLPFESTYDLVQLTREDCGN